MIEGQYEIWKLFGNLGKIVLDKLYYSIIRTLDDWRGIKFRYSIFGDKSCSILRILGCKEDRIWNYLEIG